MNKSRNKMVKWLKKFKSEVEREIKKRGDVFYRPPHTPYGNCFYTLGHCSDGSSGCLFGQVGERFGLKERMKIWDKRREPTPISVVISQFMQEERMFEGIDPLQPLSEKELEAFNIPAWCDKVQLVQDSQVPWKSALMEVLRFHVPTYDNARRFLKG